MANFNKTKLYCQGGNFPNIDEYYWYDDEVPDCSSIATGKLQIPQNVINTLIELHALTHCDLPMGYMYLDEDTIDQMVKGFSQSSPKSFKCFLLKSWMHLAERWIVHTIQNLSFWH